jgi:diguanylate cyclase (GGDEF)-like protein
MQALTDGLTGLANRRAFDEALDREWRITLRQGTQISLLLLDIDCFKGFNDKYGHQVGDDCLRAVASALATSLLRPGDITARYGGEELAVILPDTDGPGAIEVAERIRANVQALSIPHETNNAGNYLVSVSVGVATAISLVGGTMTMPEGLLTAADTALYKAKQEGRNRVASALLLTTIETSRE